MLKIAVPNKGSLAQAATEMLSNAGYRQRTDSKELTLIDAEHGVEFYYLRPRDIAVYVGSGQLDLGITGRDMLLDSGADADEIMKLGFGASRFRFAAPKGTDYELADLQGKRIASSYPGLLGAYLAERGIEASLVSLDGAVESAIRLGVADVVADVVDTGTTLKKAGLELFGDPICHSEAVVIQRSGVGDVPGAQGLLTRLSSVLVAQSRLMLDYNVEEKNLPQTVALAPGVEGPTISSLSVEGWVAVRVLVPKVGAHRLMDQLWEAGARSIILSELAACRF
ncbi:ATP phosphoribosyltransferase [Tessaracoccus caeni]|uniref:ATP phosphoribosyltransferase n=1 Tax=Tessaracoccus caeni TaxID=3031239 RepID=UPI0023DC137B|nr:ATP phosphoribosyltransferase [Tessaracoccus caeni]MDF1489832.1 ATP phosphoribosyltransferase [Tessaracoccus caeni]